MRRSTVIISPLGCALLRPPVITSLSIWASPILRFASSPLQAIEAVMATDMKQHFAMVSLFSTKFSTPASTGGSRLSGSLRQSERRSVAADEGLVKMDDELRSLVMQVCGGEGGGQDSETGVSGGGGSRMVMQVWGKVGQESDAVMEGEGDRLMMQIGGIYSMSNYGNGAAL